MAEADLAILDRPSPNFDARPDGTEVDILLLHYTGMQNCAAALDRLTDPAAKVSAHYLIDEDGTCYRLVDERARAWHAGVASWRGATDINARSIGIELVNPGHEFGYRPFPAAQIDVLIALSKSIMERHDIPSSRVLAHSDVAPGRKEDPGELFDWQALAECGIGIWPSDKASDSAPAPFADAMRQLREIGYEAPDTPVMTAEARSALIAFQRRWLARNLKGTLDPETAQRIAEVHFALA